jgi:hypothetical protein
MVCTARIQELGAVPSTKIVGDGFDAMAEAINTRYQTKSIR